MSLTVLGCTGSWPGPTGACSGYLVRSGGECLMVDCGPGTLSHLQRHTALSDLTAVIMTHAHPDHWSDFGVLRNAWKYALEMDGLRVYGPAELLERAPALVGNEPGSEGVLDWVVVGEGTSVQQGHLKLSFSVTDHYVETTAVRIDDGTTALVYTADTGPAWSPGALGPDIDVLLSEATALERSEAEADLLHLTAGEAGALAADAGADRLILTHLPADGNAADFATAAQVTYGREVEVAEIHATYQL